MSDKNLGRRTSVSVKFNNTDITKNITDNLISLTYVDVADGETDDLKIVVHDRERVWVKDWLKKELEQRDQANKAIKTGSADSGTAGTTKYTVTAKIGLNVRSGRGTSYSRIGGLSYGAEVDVYEIVNNWATIKYSGKTAYVAAWYLKAKNTSQAATTSTPSSGSWAIGDEVTVKGRGHYDSYGSSSIVSGDVTGHQGKITHLNLKSGIPYPIHVDSIGWFPEANVTKAGAVKTATETMDGSTTENAKYTKISAVITVQNVDTKGTDRVLDCGSFELDNVKFTAPPAKIELSATSLSYESTLRKTKKTKSYKSTSLKMIAKAIATAGGYNLMYVSGFNPMYKCVLQDNVSDIEFLGQRCKAAGLNLKATSGTIVIYDSKEQDDKKTVRKITWGDGSYTSISLESTLATTAYSSCHVSYEDDDGTSYEATFTPPTAFSEGEVLEVKEQVSSNEEAMELAKRRLRKENKGEITGQIKMMGDPRLVAGATIELSGFGDFDGKYSIEKATHKIPPYTTDLEISKVVEGY